MNEHGSNGSEYLKTQFMERESFNKVFIVLLVCLISIANVLMGCEIDLKLVLFTLKRPVALAIGCFTQFIIMPLLAYSLAYIILMSHGSHLFALGLFVTGCSPSGSASNFWTILLDGNAHLSVTMTFFSMLGSLVTMPFWMNILGYKFLRNIGDSTTVCVPYDKIMFSLAGLIVPLLLGVLISRFKQNVAARSRKMLRPFLILVLVFVIVFGVISNFFLLKMITWPALLAGLLLPWCGFMFGCFTSILLRQDPKDVTAIAIETGIQNTGIAIMLLKLSFPDGDGDVSMLLPIIVACFTPGPLLLGFAIHSTTKYFKSKRSEISTSESTGKSECGEELLILRPDISSFA